MTSYWDIVVVLAIAAVMLLILDWRIGRAFKRHEVREKQLYYEIQLTADGASGRVRELARQLETVQADHTLVQVDVANITEQVRMHDRRLGAVEERLVRAALSVPHHPRREGDS
jgi:hypothetical protein